MALAPVLIWSPTGTVYPAGSQDWSGQPVALAPPGTYWTPDVPIDAEEVNYVFRQTTTSLDSLQKSTMATMALNWSPEFSLGAAASYDAQTALGWDNQNRLWMSLWRASPDSHLLLTYGLDEATAGTVVSITAFTQSNPVGYADVAVDPTAPSHYWACTTDLNSGVGKLFHLWLWNGSAWSSAPGAWNTVTATGDFYGVAMTTMGAYVIIACVGTSAGDSFLLSSNNGYTTWTSAASSPGGSNTISPCAAGGTVYLKSNGAAAVAAFNLAGTSYQTFVTTNGVLWTPGIAVASGTAVGLAWTADAQGPCWLLAVQPASGAPVFYRSPDGTSWQPQSGGIATTSIVITDMAAVGSTLVATLNDASSAGPSGSIFSVDGGITWYPTQAVLTTNTSTISSANRARVASAGGTMGFMVGNAIWQRFSNLFGLPANSL